MSGGGRNLLLVALILLLSLCPAAGLAEILTVTSNADTVSGAYATVMQNSTTLCHTATGMVKQNVMSAPTTSLTLREALIRADNNDEADTIRFDATAFAPTASSTARTITINNRSFFLPWMCEGNTTVDGDVNSDGTPDVIVQSALTRQQQGTLSPPAHPPPYDRPTAWIFGISSDNNTITKFTLKHFYIAGVYLSHFIGATSTPGAISSITGNTISNNIIDNRTYDAGGSGIRFQAGSSRTERGPGGIRNTTITGNTILFNEINANSYGIRFLTYRSRSFIDGTTIGASRSDPPSVLASKRNIIRGGTIGIRFENNGRLTGLDPFTVMGSSITNTTIRGNHLLIGNDRVATTKEEPEAARIRAWSLHGSALRITDLHILDNRIEEYRYNPGIQLAGGSCGARNSQMTATIARNTLSGNGGLIPPPPGPPHSNVGSYVTPGGQPFIVDTRAVPAITLYGGEHGYSEHSPCRFSFSPRPTSSNSLTVRLEDNTVQDNYDTGIAIVGGAFLADNNTVTATLDSNTIENNGRDGVVLIGGRVLRQLWPDGTSTQAEFEPPMGYPVATGNTVSATLTYNWFDGQAAGAGLRLLAGDSGPANNNRVMVTGQGNTFVANRYDIVGTGGMATSTSANLFPADIVTNPLGTLTGSLTALFAANSGTGNSLTGSLFPWNFDPSRVVVEDGTAGNTASLMVELSRPASPPVSPSGQAAGDSPEDAAPVDLPAFGQTVRRRGYMYSVRDVDYYRLRVPVAGRLLLSTTGSLYTRGTLSADGVVLTSARGRGDRPGFQTSISVTPGDYLLAVDGTHHQSGPYTLEISWLIGSLENPRPESWQSGIGLVSGWACEAERVEIELNGTIMLEPSYRTGRADTLGVCGDSDNGFGLLFNWNLLGDGTHTARLLVNGEELDTATFTVTGLGEEFVRGAAGETIVTDFPGPGEQVRLVWQEAAQSFMLAPLMGRLTPADPPAGEGAILEVPANGSYQSGIGLVSGWVCEAGRVVIEVNGTIRLRPSYGTGRADTLRVCGDRDNGFGLLFNWNLLGDGTHTARLLVNGEELDTATFTVTGLGGEFVRGVAGETLVTDFPGPGEQVRLVWQEATQNFVLAPLPPPVSQ